jgi:hypothetical protein
MAFNVSTNSQAVFLDSRTRPGTVFLPSTFTIPGRVLTFKDQFGAFSTNSMTLTTNNANQTIDSLITSTINTQPLGWQSFIAGNNNRWYTVGGTLINTINASTVNTTVLRSVNISSANMFVSSLGIIDQTLRCTTQLYVQSSFLYYSFSNQSTIISGTRQSFGGLFTSLRRAFDPRQVSGLAFWLDAADVNTVGLNGSRVTAWRDKSGNNRNFIQTTVSNQPTYGTFLSQPGISFTGASLNFLSNTYIQTGSAGRNMFIVFYDIATTANTFGNPVLLFMATTNPSQAGDWRGAFNGALNYLGVDSRSAAYIYSTSPARTSMRSTRCIAMWGYVTGAAYNTSYVYGNGTQFTTLVNSFAFTGALNVQNSGLTYIGGNGATAAGYVTSVISEVLYYASDITTLQRQQVEGYLAWKWGLVGDLPSNHPYKTAPP